MNLFRWLTVLILALSCARAAAAQPAFLAEVRLSRVADDTWRADYVFERPVTSLRMDRVGNFRQEAWKPLSPGVFLATDLAAQADVLSMGGRSFRQLSVEIKHYDMAIPKQYLAVDRFSDGGSLFYAGFLGGRVTTGAKTWPLELFVNVAGRPGETALPPARPRAGSSHAYAYFGPQQPGPAGAASAIFDPAIPEWAKATILDATAKVSAYYAQAYGRAPSPTLVMFATMGDTTAPGLSIKGGAMGSQIAYRLGGAAFLADHPAKRALIVQLVAHEMAHVWQQQVQRGGGVGDDTPWVHEGGAEAMAHDALLKTQLWSAADGEAFVARTLARCSAAGDAFASYEGIYACGFKRFHATGVEAAPLWLAMMRMTEQTMEPYSPAMIERAASEVRPRQ